jgi:predicted nucleic acid-binding protein
MTLVLDSGGLSALARNRAKIRVMRQRGEWPPIVPVEVLVESLTGDHRRDFHVDRLLHLCTIRATSEAVARYAAGLRYRAKRAGVSAVDAIVAAVADQLGGASVWTSDPDDIAALAAHAINKIIVQRA